MKLLNILGVLFVLACGTDEAAKTSIHKSEIPKPYKLITNSAFNWRADTLYFHNALYSGYAFAISDLGDTLLLKVFENGLLHGKSKQWYPNGQLMEFREYWHNQKNGKQMGYWSNGNKRFEYTAKNDAYQGEMKEWDEQGRLSHLGNYVNGQEEGVQKLWYTTGKIRANYIIKNGRRYGLLGTKNCINVLDSIFINK